MPDHETEERQEDEQTLGCTGALEKTLRTSLNETMCLSGDTVSGVSFEENSLVVPVSVSG